MKKAGCALLLIICLLSVCSCGRQSYFKKEQEIYDKTVSELFTALDSGDADAIYSLFSRHVQSECADLKEKIEKLISFYGGPTDSIGKTDALGGNGLFDYGNNNLTACTTFPVFCNGQYYWFYLELTYENDFDADRVGITQLDFYTADSYYDYWWGENMHSEAAGLNIFEKTVAGYNIISVDNFPYDYHPGDTLDIEQIKSFFENSASLSEFKKEFGTAAAITEYSLVYPLPERQYLYMDYSGNQIVYAAIVDSYCHIETVVNE